MSFDVFLCHNSKDKPAVKEIGLRLKAAGLEVWLDEWDLRPGLPWMPEIEKQIKTAGAAAVFFGPEGIGPWQENERQALLSQLVRRQCPVIPVFLSTCPDDAEIPLFLENLTWVDFRGKEPHSLDRLVWGITGKKPSEARNQEPPRMPLHNLPFASLGKRFEGREELLAELDKHLAPGAPAALVQAQTVSGLGGVGKTRLAIEFAYRHAERYSAIFFVGADGEAELRRNFAGLAQRSLLHLGLPPGTPEDAVLDEVKVALRDRSGWLLIFDNVDTGEAQQAVRRLLPLPGGQVLITSRLQNWPTGTPQVQVDKLEPQAALDYLLKATDTRRRRANDEDMAARLAANLGYLPLGLELTAAYVRVNGLSFEELLANWAKEEQNLLDWFDPGATDYSRSLAVTWALSFEKLSAPAQVVLSLLAHLAPEPVPQAMFEEGGEILAEAAGGDLDLRAALADLQRYSLVALEQEGEQKVITLHRLVQSVARGRISSEERVLWAERVIGLVLGYAPLETNDVRTWPIWEPLRPHAARVIEIAEEVGIADRAAVLMGKLGVLMTTKALFGDAEKFLQRALVLSETSLGQTHPEVATPLNNLANLFRITNRPVEAELLIRRALSIDEASFGDDHPNVASNLSNLAALLAESNRLAEAETLMRRALLIDEANLGKDHPNVAIDLNNLAQLLRATDRLDEAEPLMRRALSIDEAQFGKDHPNVARQLSNLATALHYMKRSAEAESLMRRALSIDEASFGENHPSVARDLNNLARLLQDTNRLAEAEPLMRRALAIFERSLGGDHPSTSAVRQNLEILLNTISAVAGDPPAEPVCAV